MRCRLAAVGCQLSALRWRLSALGWQAALSFQERGGRLTSVGSGTPHRTFDATSGAREINAIARVATSLGRADIRITACVTSVAGWVTRSDFGATSMAAGVTRDTLGTTSMTRRTTDERSRVSSMTGCTPRSRADHTCSVSRGEVVSSRVEVGADGVQAVEGAFEVGVDADGVEGDRDLRAVAGDDGVFAREQRSLRGCFFDGQQ